MTLAREAFVAELGAAGALHFEVPTSVTDNSTRSMSTHLQRRLYRRASSARL